MTETSILPISSGEAEPPSFESQPPDEDGVGANRRKLLIAGGVVSAGIVAVAAFLLLHGGSTPAPAGAVPHGTYTHASTATTAPTAGHSGTKSTSTTLPKKSKVQAGRDPFTALYTAPDTGGTSVGGTTTVSSTPTPASTSASTPSTSTTSTAPSPQPTQSGIGSPTYIQLLSTHGTKSAVFRVGYPHHKFKKFDVAAPASGSSTGTVFDREFALISIVNGTATLQIGDGAPFELTTGISRTT